MKNLMLGKAEVSFKHEYKTSVIWDDKSGSSKKVAQPIATKAIVVVSGETSESVAKCSPKDHFTFEKGRKISLSRAMKANSMLSDKTDRTRVWDEYNKLKPNGRW